MTSGGDSTRQRNQGTTKPLHRRYRWNDLTEPEQDAMRDALSIAGTRAAIGVGVVATLAAGLTSGALQSSATTLDAAIRTECHEN
jgi:hypothetical protein